MSNVISEDQKQTFVSLWLLKKLDLDPKEGGIEIPVVVPSELSPFDEYLQELAVEDYVTINAKKAVSEGAAGSPPFWKVLKACFAWSSACGVKFKTQPKPIKHSSFCAHTYRL